MEILAFYAIAIEPIEIQKCSAPQNDRLDLSFLEDIYVYAEKLTRNGRKTAIQLSQILATTLQYLPNYFKGLSTLYAQSENFKTKVIL